MKRCVLFALVIVMGIGVLSAGAAEIAVGGVLGEPVEVQGNVIIPVTAMLHGGVIPVGMLVVKDGVVSVVMEESGKRFAEAFSGAGHPGRENVARGGKECSMKASKGEDAPVKSCPKKAASSGDESAEKKCPMKASGKTCPKMSAPAAAESDSDVAAPAESGDAPAEVPAKSAHH